MKKFFLFAGSLLSACHQLADPAPSGANTFSCQIEGEYFEPYLGPSSQPFTGPKISALQAGPYNRRGGLAIEARTNSNDITIVLLDARAPGTYQLDNGTPFWKPRHSYASLIATPSLPATGIPLPRAYYDTDSIRTGTVTLTRYDTLAHVAGGTFSFTARDAATGKLAHLTNGRFDVAL